MADSMPRTSACSATFAKPGGPRIIADECAIRLQLANLRQPLERCQIVLDLIAIAQPTIVMRTLFMGWLDGDA